MNEYIDIGANLTHKSFRRDQSAVIAAAKSAGVVRIVVTGTAITGSQAAVHLARDNPEMLAATVGVHPHNARQWQARDVATLRALAANPGAVAIGECGLDYNRDFSPRPEQRRCFADQLGLAADLGLPVFLHERDAHEDFLATLRDHWPSLRGAVVHCFTGDARTLDAYLDLGTHIGLTGWICDERRGRHLVDLASRIPSNRLMLETDSPFITPRTLRPRPQRNEPQFLPHVAAAIARAARKPLTQLAAETTANARAFFGLREA